MHEFTWDPKAFRQDQRGLVPLRTHWVACYFPKAMALLRAPVVENLQVGPGYYQLVLGSGQSVGVWQPGQFVMLRAWAGWDPLLPRALSLYGRGPGDRIEVLFKVVGPGTARLAELAPGAEVVVHGPLGQGFRLEDEARTHLLVAGGIGIVPLLPLASALEGRRTILLYGGRSAADLAGAGDFDGLCETRFATDDGSVGRHGFVTELLAEALANEPAPAVYACGPDAMLGRVAAICREAGVPGQLALEAPMACGYGACLGCVVSTRDGYRRVCREGPVFRAQEVYL